MRKRFRFSLFVLLGIVTIAAIAFAYVRYQRAPDIFELTSDGFGPIKLGMTRKEYMAKLRQQRHALKHSTITQFYDGNLDIHCTQAGPEGRVQFIQAWCGSHDSGVVFTYQGVDLFDAPSNEIHAMFSENEPAIAPNVDCEFPGQGIATSNPTEDHDHYGGYQRAVLECVAIATPEYWGPKHHGKPKDHSPEPSPVDETLQE